jgi:hypothetical protein
MIVSFHEVCAHKTSLTLPHFSEVSVPSQKHMSGHAKGIAFAQSYDLHIKDAMNLSILHNICNFCDTEVVICIILCLVNSRWPLYEN